MNKLDELQAQADEIWENIHQYSLIKAKRSTQLERAESKRASEKLDRLYKELNSVSISISLL